MNPFYTRMTILLFIIIFRHQLAVDRPVTASFDSLFKGLSSRLRPFGLYFSIIFGILLLFTLITCRGQFYLYLLSFSSTGSIFNSSKISLFCWGQKGCTQLIWKFSFGLMSIVFHTFFWGSNFRFHIKEWGVEPVHYILCSWKFLDQSWFNSFVLDLPVFEQNLLVLVNIFFIPIGNFTTEIHITVTRICLTL